MLSDDSMPTPRHILFPYDFSRYGREVVRFVRALAGRCGARVTILGVVPPTFASIPDEMVEVRAGDDTAVWKQRLQTRLDDAFHDELAGLCVDRVAEGGDPALRITAFAQSHEVDLIMMPTQGLGMFRSLLVGSVTSKVLHDAKCPVWTAAHAEAQTAADVARMILCAIDGSSSTLPVVRWAMEFSSSIGARLNLLHVVGPISDWPALESERRLQEHVRDDARQKITSLLKEGGIDLPLRVAIGGIVQTATEEARQEQADLMIIGRGSISEPFGRLRTHAFGIIQRSPCPVLSV